MLRAPAFAPRLRHLNVPVPGMGLGNCSINKQCSMNWLPSVPPHRADASVSQVHVALCRDRTQQWHPHGPLSSQGTSKRGLEKHACLQLSIPPGRLKGKCSLLPSHSRGRPCHWQVLVRTQVLRGRTSQLISAHPEGSSRSTATATIESAESQTDGYGQGGCEGVGKGKKMGMRPRKTGLTGQGHQVRTGPLNSGQAVAHS